MLLPPNLNTLAVHFVPGTNGEVYFEIDFENAATDVRVVTKCASVTDNRGAASGGCEQVIDPTLWAYLAPRNKGGDPLEITVRGTSNDQSCFSASSARAINFTTQDVTGGLYYWQSVLRNGVAGLTGGIFGKSFGTQEFAPEGLLSPGQTLNKCVGCHFASRDGVKMTFGDDDADSDDEYGDQHTYIFDLPTRTPVATPVAEGFKAFEGTGHDYFFGSDGVGASSTPEMLQFVGSSGSPATTASFSTVTGLSGLRATQPEVSRDGSTIYFIAGTTVTNSMYTRTDDHHFTNGSLWSGTLTAGSSGATISNLVKVQPYVGASGLYYPAISSDGTTVAFDVASGDSYNNPNATLYAMVPGQVPVNLSVANAGGSGLTNSWPRWGPSVETYKGKRLSWLVFTSTRDYGLRVKNQGSQYFNCYPEGTPEDPSGDHAKPFDPNCTQPQLWMAAVFLDDIQNRVDGSFPAFWIPFQDYTAHSNTPQWVDSYTTLTNCQLAGASCASAACCTGETCDSTMTCVSNIP